MKPTLLDTLQTARSENRPAVLITELETGSQAIVIGSHRYGDLELDSFLLSEVERAKTDDRSRTIALEGVEQNKFFIHVFNPPKRLIVVGAVHIAQPLVSMATISEYQVTVVDPRGAFATKARFPGVELIEKWPDEALANLKLDRRTAVVTLTHDPKLDDPALTTALASDAFYIGALGSRRTHAARLERLRKTGCAKADLERIHGPVGLVIGAKSPAEISISILGQMTEKLHAPKSEQTG